MHTHHTCSLLSSMGSIDVIHLSCVMMRTPAILLRQRIKIVDVKRGKEKRSRVGTIEVEVEEAEVEENDKEPRRMKTYFVCYKEVPWRDRNCISKFVMWAWMRVFVYVCVCVCILHACVFIHTYPTWYCVGGDVEYAGTSCTVIRDVPSG